MPLAGPVLMLAQVSGSHGDSGTIVQAGAGGVGADLLGGLRQRPPVGIAPGRAGPQPVAPRELDGDLAVAHPQLAHLLPQGTLLGPQARLRVCHAVHFRGLVRRVLAAGVTSTVVARIMIRPVARIGQKRSGRAHQPPPDGVPERRAQGLPRAWPSCTRESRISATARSAAAIAWTGSFRRGRRPTGAHRKGPDRLGGS